MLEDAFGNPIKKNSFVTFMGADNKMRMGFVNKTNDSGKCTVEFRFDDETITDIIDSSDLVQLRITNSDIDICGVAYHGGVIEKISVSKIDFGTVSNSDFREIYLAPLMMDSWNENHEKNQLTLNMVRNLMIKQANHYFYSNVRGFIVKARSTP